MTTGQTIKKAVDTLHNDHMSPMLTALRWQDPGIYGNWLGQTYHYVRHTIPLLKAALARCSEDQSAMKAALEAGIRGEAGHDELLRKDLKYIKADLAPEHAATRAFHEALYNAIDAEGPAPLFGRVLLLEGIAEYAGPQNYEQAALAHGEGAATFLKVHIDADGGEQGHFNQAIELIMSFSEQDQCRVIDGMNDSVRLYTELLIAVDPGLARFAHARV